MSGNDYRLFVKLQGKGFNPAGWLDSDKAGEQDNIDPTFRSWEDAHNALKQWIEICKPTETPVLNGLIVSSAGVCGFYDRNGRDIT